MSVIRREKLIHWLRLIRVPNLFTVPGDSLAGFVLCSGKCSGWVLPGCMVISLCLYTAGIITNDYVGMKEDSVERGGRPLACGQISPAAALTVSVLLILCGLIGAALLSMQMLRVAVLLTILIVVYNAFAKEVFLLGPLFMGLCRGLNLLLGAAASNACFLSETRILIPVFGMVLFIAAVTFVSRKEAQKKKAGIEAWAPLVSLVIFYPIFFAMNSETDRFALVCALLIAGCCVRAARRAQTESIPPAVGLMICALPLFQASLISGLCSLFVPLMLILLMPAALLLGKKFYSS